MIPPHFHGLSLEPAQVPVLRPVAAAPQVQGRTQRQHGTLDAGPHRLGKAMEGPQETHALPSPGPGAYAGCIVKY